MTVTDPDRHWTLDRRVPLALILAMAAYAAGGIWYLAEISSRTAATEAAVAALVARQSAAEARLGTVDVLMGRIEERLQAQSAALSRIEATLLRALDMGAVP